jgi:hypothetical protein
MHNIGPSRFDAPMQRGDVVSGVVKEGAGRAQRRGKDAPGEFTDQPGSPRGRGPSRNAFSGSEAVARYSGKARARTITRRRQPVPNRAIGRRGY